MVVSVEQLQSLRSNLTALAPWMGALGLPAAPMIGAVADVSTMISTDGGCTPRAAMINMDGLQPVPGRVSLLGEPPRGRGAMMRPHVAAARSKSRGRLGGDR